MWAALGAAGWPPKSEAPSPRACVSVPLAGKRGFAGVIKLRILKWGDDPGLSSWTLNGEGEEPRKGDERGREGRTQSPLSCPPSPYQLRAPATQTLFAQQGSSQPSPGQAWLTLVPSDSTGIPGGHRQGGQHPLPASHKLSTLHTELTTLPQLPPDAPSPPKRNAVAFSAISVMLMEKKYPERMLLITSHAFLLASP